MNKVLMALAMAGVLAFATGCEWTAGSGVSTWANDTVAVDFSGVYAADGSYIVTEPGSAVSNSVAGERMTSGNGGTSYAGTLAHPPVAGTLVVRAGDVVLYDNGSGGLVMATNSHSSGYSTTNTASETIGEISMTGGGTNVVVEQIGLGDGSSTAFSGILAYAPIVGSLVITVGGYVFTDVGSTNLSCNIADGSYGTLNRITSKWTLSFPAPISIGTPIVASYFSGGGSSSAYSGSLSHAPLANSVTITVGDYVFTDTGSDQLTCNIADGSTANVNHLTGAWAMSIVQPPAIGTPIIAAYRYVDSTDAAGSASGTINYAGGTWTLSFSEGLSGNDTALADYMYVTGLQKGNHGNGIFTLTVAPMGSNIRITDNNGSVYEGTMGVNTTDYAMEAQFSANGISQGYKVTIVGTLAASSTTAGGTVSRVLHGTYIEENGYSADILAFSDISYPEEDE